MTLLARNNCFKGGIIFTVLSLCFAAIGGIFAFSVLPETGASAAVRSGGLILSIIENLVEPSAHVPFWTILFAAIYSLVSMALIYHFFEKTQSPEILFIGFFMISLAFELARLAIPLRAVFPFPSMYLVGATRILFFGRYFGLLSLFAASIYAAGLDAQKQQNIFLMLTIAAIVIAANVPVDSLVWDSTYKLLSGYRLMFTMVEIGFLAITVLTFLVTAYNKGSKRYVFIGIGVFMLFAGRNTLFLSDTWITPFPGLALLVAGTWLVCSRLHQEYLWL